MKIGIVPSIQEKYIGQFEYNCDLNLISFLKKIYKRSNIEILTFDHKIDKKYNLLVISGANGNDLTMFDKSKKNLIRNKLDLKFFNKAIKNNIPVLGICHGAQFIAKKFNSSLKKKKHLGNHYIFTVKPKKKLLVNSYHNKVVFKLGKNLICKAFSEDNTIEYFEHRYKKIVGIMWHPERFKKIKKLDHKIIKTLCT